MIFLTVDNIFIMFFFKVKEWTSSAGSRSIYKDIQRMTFEASAKAMVGYHFDSSKDMEYYYNVFDDMIQNLFSLPYDLPFTGFRKVRNLVPSGFLCKNVKLILLHNSSISTPPYLQHAASL